MARTWFITGSSRGIGRAWAQAALDRGDRVAATARDVDDLAGLVDAFGDAVIPMTLDVTDRSAVLDTVAAAAEQLGRIDVVVNNAGYGHDGVVEDVSEAHARAQMDTNFFGALWVTQAVIPIMRSQGGGHIVQMSTQGGHFCHPGLGLYHASKWALEGLTESLAQEVNGFGIHTTLVEPGAVATEWFGASATRSPENPLYDEALAHRWGDFDPADMPSPDVIVDAAMAAVDADEPPLRLLVTNQAYDNVTGVYRQRLDSWAEWESVSRSATAR